MQHDLALILTYLICCTVSSDTLALITSQTHKPIYQILLKAIVFVKQTVGTSYIISGSKVTCCPLSLWWLQCSWQAFSRVYNVPSLSAALCHVVTSNGVTICGSQFPPTVSKHCPHQHSATHKTIQQYATVTIPSVVISKVPLPQSNIMAVFVRSHCSLLCDVCPDLPT